jgi:hypothetical protein
MTLVQELARAMGRWQSLYSDSTLVSATVTTAHIVTLLVAGGLAISADRAALRALRQPAAERWFHLRELGAVHRPVLVALTLLFVSGILLAAADVETFAGSVLFWLKMGLVALLLANGVLLQRAESKLVAASTADVEPTDERLWRRLASHARASMTLWLLIAVAGTVLTNS